ncbi:hypothetical protein [Marinicrinis lubricantis]|uniref:Uncharacterized protein n=1 Tax=Marinicrinis lubricantis TaxID=2086470 RepID=A0ABW1IKX3_9BACL
MQPALEQRFHEHAKTVSQGKDIVALIESQYSFDQLLKQQLSYDQFRIILEWESALNYRNAMEKEAMYVAGFRDGMANVKELQEFISG